MQRAALVLLLACGMSFASFGGEPGEHPGEKAGEAIYRRGEAATVDQVEIGDPPVAAPLALFSCRGCHGDDGRGLAEGGVVAPEIRWSYLAKPYAVRGGPFRLRPAYDERLFSRALREGVDSAGRRFDTAMPRYPLGDAEIGSLIAYLRALDQAEKASPFGAEIPIGIRLPPSGEAIGRRQGEVLRAVLETFFDAINTRGGIYERKIRPHFLAAGEPFAAGLAAGLDLALPRGGRAEQLPPPADAVPVLALFPSTADSRLGTASARFTLYSGPEDRSAALRLFAQRTLGIEPAALAIVGGDLASPSRVAGGDQASRALLYEGDDAEQLRRALAALPADTVLLLARWLENPQLMDLARQHPGPVYVATPPTAHFLTDAGQTLLSRLEASRPLPADQRMVQLWALAAARVLEAALEKAGRDLRPEALSGIFETFSDLETGFGPALRFAPSRLLGARGAVILRLASGQDAVAGWQWVELD